MVDGGCRVCVCKEWWKESREGSRETYRGAREGSREMYRGARATGQGFVRGLGPQGPLGPFCGPVG